MMKWILIGLAVVIISVLVYVFLFFYSQTDVKNVHLQGYVYDSNHQALQNADIAITNWRYTSDDGFQNYDEYLGEDIVMLKTDDKGYFSINFPLSAKLRIYVEKSGYAQERKNIYPVRKNMSVEIELERIEKD